MPIALGESTSGAATYSSQAWCVMTHACQSKRRSERDERMAPVKEPVRRIPARRVRDLWIILSILSLVLAIWACGATPAITHQPASGLRLALGITDQYSGDTSKSTVQVEVLFFEAASGKDVFIPDGAHLTCDGVDMQPNQARLVACPRHEPGDEYRFVYTDEQGNSMTVHVPIATKSLTLVAPTAGSNVTIPQTNALDLRYTVPALSPGATASIEGATAICGPAETTACGSVRYGHLNPLPVDVMRFGLTGARASAGGGTFSLTGDYTSFRPSAGTITLFTALAVTPDRSGFAEVTAVFVDTVNTPIIWTR